MTTPEFMHYLAESRLLESGFLCFPIPAHLRQFAELISKHTQEQCAKLAEAQAAFELEDGYNACQIIAAEIRKYTL